MTITAGLDVGGAHLKVALVEDGRTQEVRQIACPLWQGLDKLDTALGEASPLLARAGGFAVTMTGELSDLFPDRKTGVATLVGRITREVGSGVRFWMSDRFGDATAAAAHPAAVGSTNFLATAAFVARHHPDALLIDFGSTTADIVPITGGRPVPRGVTDFERQATGELVYTGLTRTAVMGIAQAAPFKGRWVTLAREYLATMADVRRILGADLEPIDLHATADGKGKSLAESIARFARMFGCDANEGSLRDWQISARFVREVQLRSIEDGALQVLSQADLPDAAPIVAAGIGADDVAMLAARLERACSTFSTLANAAPGVAFWAGACAPAVAVALLLSS